MPDPLLSVIIPVGPYEDKIPQGLLQDLQHLSDETELIFVGCCQEKQQSLFEQLPSPIRTVFSAQGRAQQMNYGAEKSIGKFLWFLHLDSRFSPVLLNQLAENLKRCPEALHYNLLAFTDEGSGPMKVNAVGANLRSKVLGVPFGDQGFAIARDLFFKIGSYPEDVAYGEDHLFVWYARQQGVKLLCNPHYLLTSSRKYGQQGWLRLTLKYQYLWLRQALPEFIKLLKKRYFSRRCQR